MNGIKSRIIGLLPMIMMPLVSCLLLSCLNEDEEDLSTTENGKASVQLHITTDGITDLNATRVDENAISKDEGSPGEFMNTLCIFIVDATSGEIELKLQPDLEESEADIGDLEDYTTEDFNISTGTKTIYAFANWDSAESTEWNALIAKEVGETIEKKDLSFTITDPASKVDIANCKYIPMSGKLENVSIGDVDSTHKSNNVISVVLDRLVGKVTVTVVGDNECDINIESLCFEGTADNVSLFPILDNYGVSWSNITFGKVTKTIDSGITPTITTVTKGSGKEKIATFYINESYRTNSTVNAIKGYGYTLTLNMQTTNNYDKYDGSEYKAMTTFQNVPRNYIYPVKLQFDAYNVEFGITAKTVQNDIEVEYRTDDNFHEADDGYFLITLRDITSSFTIKPILNKISGNETTPLDDVNWEWTSTEIQCSTENDGTLSVTLGDNMTDYEYRFTLTASWSTTDSDSELTVEHERKYNVKVVLKEGDYTIVD